MDKMLNGDFKDMYWTNLAKELRVDLRNEYTSGDHGMLVIELSINDLKVLINDHL